MIDFPGEDQKQLGTHAAQPYLIHRLRNRNTIVGATYTLAAGPSRVSHVGSLYRKPRSSRDH